MKSPVMLRINGKRLTDAQAASRALIMSAIAIAPNATVRTRIVATKFTREYDRAVEAGNRPAKALAIAAECTRGVARVAGELGTEGGAHA